MKIEKENYLPLFFHLWDPVGIYILDDKLIGMDETGVCFQFRPGKTFELLNIFYNYPKAKHVFPRSLQRYLYRGYNPEIKRISYPYPRVIGIEESGFCNYCFDFDIALKEDPIESVLFYNFKYEYQDKIINFNNEIRLSFEEAFIILANACTASAITFLEHYLLQRNKSVSYSKSFYLKLVENYYKETVNTIGEEFANTNHQIYYFSIAYLQHQKKQLEQKIIHPAELLRLNGAKVLAILAESKPVEQFIYNVLHQFQDNYQQLTKNQKIMYYVLFLFMLHDNSILSEKLGLFYKQNQHIFQHLKKEFLIGMPLEEGHKKEYPFTFRLK